MSTFGGRVPELENISIDRFDRDNLKSSCFFLSHCHTDHMNGLDDYAFTQLFKKNKNFKLYCSRISKLIVMNLKLDLSESQIVEVTSQERTVIHVPESESIPVGYDVTVTFLSAGHCPGSVMFLFETLTNRILYTGDFRYAKGDSEKIKQIHDYLWLKSFDKVYFDATFLNEDYWEFPSRYDSTEEILNLIEEWLARNPENTIHLETPAKYGYEYVFQKIFQRFGYKICVDESIYHLYWNVGDIGFVLTKDQKVAKVVSHAKNSNTLSCENKHVLHITMSAQFYRWKKGQSKPALCHKFMKGNRISAQVVFATHSSCSELVDFLCYLRPKNVYACTSTVGISEQEKQNYLLKLRKTWLEDKEEKKTDSQTNFNHFETVSLSNTPLKIKINHEEKATHNCLLDSPPVRRTRLSFNSSIL